MIGLIRISSLLSLSFPPHLVLLLFYIYFFDSLDLVDNDEKMTFLVIAVVSEFLYLLSPKYLLTLHLFHGFFLF